MRRVYVVVEGPTEESFVKQVLAPVLWPFEVYLTPLIIGAPGHKGGNTNYARLSKDVILQLKQDRDAYCSMMLDFYGLGPGFPGTPLPQGLSLSEKVRHIERAVKADLIHRFPELRADVRFVPYLQTHEYEALLFSDSATFATAIGQQHLAAQFEKIRNAFPTPEHINDNPNTAPSKRVVNAYPGYRKVVDGTLAGLAIGIDRMRHECQHFREWIEQLEALG